MLTQDLKQSLYNYCSEHVEEQIAFLQKEMNSMQISANSETKASAGDKHETSRAMAHLEKEKVAKQLAEKLNLRKVIAQLHPEKNMHSAQLGSLIQTNNGIYYLAIPMGKIDLNKDHYFVVSPISPIGRILINARKGDALRFNGKALEIQDII